MPRQHNPGPQFLLDREPASFDRGVVWCQLPWLSNTFQLSGQGIVLLKMIEFLETPIGM